MKCIIVEDQPPAQRILKRYIEDVGDLKLVGVFPDAIKALNYIRSHQVDLMFLDINLPKMSGIDLMRNVYDLPKVILTTAYSEYALESYEFSVVDYLLKPFSFLRFIKAVSKVQQPVRDSNKENVPALERKEDIFIKSGYDHIKVNLEEVLFIRADEDYTEICFLEKKLLTSESLKNWIEKLDTNWFVRVHRSYIVNMDKIEKVSGNEIILANKKTVPLGRAYRQEFVQRFLK
ncbi:LytTR family DNA-binding domain-containing protein [Echinicola sp. 20G]|uniref:LytR/AlgR family response regulator transcription factor n=1 Tax=Echinicola sp. 20G TaxID=2781961 RepID=UPI0019101CCA|nr:LytTR family DNA-binding domain-containing protein [Echinicola sp. 20G]